MKRALVVALSSGMVARVAVACVGEDPVGSTAATAPDSGAPEDSSAANDSGSPDGDAPADAGVDAATKRIVFVTGAKYPATFGFNTDPWVAADEICTNEAKGSGLAGTFVAWVSYKNSLGTAFNAASRIADAPYYLPVSATEGGAPILAVESKSKLLTTGPRAPIDRYPNGALAETDSASFTKVWTGTDVSGNATGIDCKAWTLTIFDGGDPTATSGNAVRYVPPTTKDWTDFDNRVCGAPARFYCFQN